MISDSKVVLSCGDGGGCHNTMENLVDDLAAMNMIM